MAVSRRLVALVVVGFSIGVIVGLLNGCASFPTDEQVLNIQERQVVEDVRYGLEL